MSDPVSTLAICRWLKSRVSEWETEAKRSLSMLAGERRAAVVDGEVLGHVTLAKGRRTARVANEDALLAYVKAHFPTEVEVVESVRPAFLKHLLDDAVKKGAHLDSDGVVIDGLIEIVQGDCYPMTKLSDDADIAIAGLLQRGALGVHGIQALPEPADRYTQDREASGL